jgi:hypothetical protein
MNDPLNPFPFDIPEEIMEAARTVSRFFQKNNVSKWELGGICSRNHADDSRVLEDFRKFIKENNLLTSTKNSDTIGL